MNTTGQGQKTASHAIGLPAPATLANLQPVNV